MRSKSGRRPLFGVHYHCKGSISLGHPISKIKAPSLYGSNIEAKSISKRLLVWGSSDYSFRIRTNRAGCREPCPLFIVLRHRAPSCPLYLSEETHKLFALSRVFLLSSGGKRVLLVKKKVPSRSGILLSMHVVLMTRHANPNIHARRY